MNMLSGPWTARAALNKTRNLHTPQNLIGAITLVFFFFFVHYRKKLASRTLSHGTAQSSLRLREPNLNSETERESASKMAEVISLMDIDEDENQNHSSKPNKGKNVVVVSGTPPDSKATPWVEKYRPQSLADVAAHRDIVDTSEQSSPPFSLYSYRVSVICVIRFFFNWFLRSFKRRK